MPKWVLGRRPAQLLGDTDGCSVVGREALQAPQERTGSSFTALGPPLCPALLEDAERESIIAQNSSCRRENEI